MALMAKIRSLASQAQESVIRWGERRMYQAFSLYYAALSFMDKTNDAEAINDKSRGLRTPVARIVEYYVAHLWPGVLPDALPIEFDDPKNPRGDALKAAIEQIWKWSNWTNKKQLAARWFALKGDIILKAASTKNQEEKVDRVYIQVIDPGNVSELTVDERGIIQRIRIDVPFISRDDEGNVSNKVHTELWTLTQARFWTHDQPVETPIARLGTPTTMVPLTADQAGIDGVIPIVHAPFRDVGEQRGVNAFLPTIVKIDEADTMTSRLHQIIFRFKQVLWAIKSRGTDSDGRPLPPPAITGDSSTTPANIQLGTETFVTVDGDIECLVPSLDFSDMLEVVKAQVEEVKSDQPELVYYEAMSSRTQIATETLRLMLSPAIARLTEVRASAEQALARIDSIALTMAQNLGIPNFQQTVIGTYSAGEFDHHFKKREVYELTASEQTDLDTKKATLLKAKRDAGIPLEIALAEVGYSAEDITKILAKADQEAEKRQTLADTAMAEAEKKIMAGGDLPPKRVPVIN